MSIAFPAVVLFMYALPGIIFRRAMTIESPNEKPALTDEIAQGAVYACIGHGIWIWLSTVVGKKVDLDAALMHATGQYGKDLSGFTPAIHAITDHVWWVIGYFVSLNALAFVLGLLVRKIRLGELAPSWTFEWFRGDRLAAIRFQEWSGINPAADVVAIPILSAVVEVGGVGYMYVGIVDSIGWNADGSPERFVLKHARMRRLDASGAGLGDSWEELGDTFIISASAMKAFSFKNVGIAEDVASSAHPSNSRNDSEAGGEGVNSKA